MLKLVIAARAQREIARAADWWEKRRDKAPEAFEEELSRGYETIRESPNIGMPVKSRREGIRKLPLLRIRYYLYYRVIEDDAVEVISVWHFSRRPPRL